MILCDEIGYNVTHQNEKHVSRLCTAQSRQYSINKISEEINEKVYKSETESTRWIPCAYGLKNIHSTAYMVLTH